MSEKILIVDDEDVNLRLLTQWLIPLGYDIEVALNGKEAVRKARDSRVDLIILDIMMPVMDGYEVCRILKVDPETKNIPIIMVTALHDRESKLKGLSVSANDFLSKPIDQAELTIRVSNLLRIKAFDDFMLRHNQILEEEIGKRTAELSSANDQLKLELEERTRVEQTLDQLKNQYEMILQSAGEGIIGVDTNERITFVNPAAEQLLGYRGQELIGRSGHESWHNSNPDGTPYSEEDCPIVKAGREGAKYSGTDEVFWRRDGTSFPVEYTATPVKKGDRLSGMVIIFRDITERKTLRDAEISKRTADLANKAKSEFLANMSHELRTPLNSIIGFSEILQDELLGKLNEEQKEMVDNNLSSGMHLLSLINDILDLSKVEAGMVEIELSRFLLKDTLHASMAMLKEKAMKHRITLSLDLKSDANIEIEADERRLKQIMFNLLSNAVKFMADGGSVRVTARLMRDEGRGTKDEGGAASIVPVSEANGHPSSIEISVSDTGIGIKPGDMDKLFHEFSQLESVYTKTKDGTGLGLALTKKLVELHGGKIWAESEYGKGSRFLFVMPVGRLKTEEN
ncbi:MAG: ATP-binding protein [Nitrospirae bacterium]|nr:ATP-binding protein [Nitrospirota bacterium]